MDHLLNADIPWQEADGSRFTGAVEVARLASPPGEGTAMAAVRFASEARTFWHSHPGGQVLWVLSGRAIVATEHGESLVAGAGDTVVAPSGELHWHGALPEGPMVHLSVTSDGGVQWSGAVDDVDYHEAAERGQRGR